MSFLILYSPKRIFESFNIENMKKIVLICLIVWGSSDVISQNFAYPIGQHLVAEVQTSNYEPFWIEINTPTPQAITYKWIRLSNTFPASWSYSLCDYGNCAVGIPSSGTMSPISQTDAENGTIGFLHLNLTVGENYGQGKVEIYVYDENDFNNGDTVSWDITWTNTTGIDKLDELGASIFPNPVNDQLTVEIENSELVSAIRIYGIDGKEQYASNGVKSTNTIDVGNLPDGVYFVELVGNHGERKVSKIIVQ
jgi:hypothetical protein